MPISKEELIKKLNEDLAGELSAIIQYIAYSAKVHGPMRLKLAEFFAAEIADETGHAQFLSKKIVSLGGEPTTTPRPVAAAKTNKEMLQAVVDAEKRAIRDYTERAKQAEEYGDKGLQVQLENIVSDETGHYEETDRLLRDWTDWQ
jgi:bacterioferritin